jgi:hypothetical protein
MVSAKVHPCSNGSQRVALLGTTVPQGQSSTPPLRLRPIYIPEGSQEYFYTDFDYRSLKCYWGK